MAIGQVQSAGRDINPQKISEKMKLLRIKVKSKGKFFSPCTGISDCFMASREAAAMVALPELGRSWNLEGSAMTQAKIPWWFI